MRLVVPVYPHPAGSRETVQGGENCRYRRLRGAETAFAVNIIGNIIQGGNAILFNVLCDNFADVPGYFGFMSHVMLLTG